MMNIGIQNNNEINYTLQIKRYDLLEPRAKKLYNHKILVYYTHSCTSFSTILFKT